jgi:hypothetical protein
VGVSSLEARTFGAPLTTTERVAAGVAALAGIAGHVVLGLAALLFFAVVLGVV